MTIARCSVWHLCRRNHPRLRKRMPQAPAGKVQASRTDAVFEASASSGYQFIALRGHVVRRGRRFGFFEYFDYFVCFEYIEDKEKVMATTPNPSEAALGAPSHALAAIIPDQHETDLARESSRALGPVA